MSSLYEKGEKVSRRGIIVIGLFSAQFTRKTQAKNPGPCGPGFFFIDAWQFPTLTWGDPTLPSALRRFTSEFGMGSGGTTALKPPGKFLCSVLCLSH